MDSKAVQHWPTLNISQIQYYYQRVISHWQITSLLIDGEIDQNIFLNFPDFLFSRLIIAFILHFYLKRHVNFNSSEAQKPIFYVPFVGTAVNIENILACSKRYM